MAFRLFACSSKQEIISIVINEEAIVLQGYTIESYIDYLFELGDTYLSDAYESEDGDLIIEVNDDQRTALMDYYDRLYESYLENFLEQDENYAFVGSDDYSSFTVYCDENIDMHDLYDIVLAAAYNYSFNHALYAKTHNDTTIQIAYYETGEIVMEGSFLFDSLTVESSIWE